MKIRFLIAFFLCLCYTIAANNTDLSQKDSLYLLIKRNSHDTTVAKAYMEIGNVYMRSDSDSIIYYTEKGLAVIEKSLGKADKKTKRALLYLKAGAYNNMGYAHCHLGNTIKGLAEYEQSMKIREELGDKLGVAESLNNIAVVYDEQGDAAKAIDYYLRSLKLLEETGEKYGMGYILNNIAFVYKNLGDVEKAILYSKRALEIRKSINDQQGIGESLNSIGLLETDFGQLDSALVKFETSLKIFQDLGSKRQATNSLINIGRIHLEKKNYRKAMDYFNQSLRIAEEIKDKRNFINSHLAISEASFEMNELETAASSAEKALSTSLEVKQPEVIRSAANLLHKIRKKKGDFKKSLEMYELYIQMNDSILSTENKRALVQKEFQYEYEKKTAADSIRNHEFQKIEKIKHENEIGKQRAYTYGGLIGFILMLLIAILSFNAYRQKQRSNKLIEEKQKEIIDSIMYARRIQKSLLPTEKYIDNCLKRLKKD